MRIRFELELQKFFENHLERRFLVAVSGGKDSMALLYRVVRLRAKMNFEIMVATFDHQIRVEGATDAAFVRDYCKQQGVTCVVGTANVPEIASQRGQNLEATAREVRYEFLVKTAREHSIGVVMTAHHADDQAETILMHLIRGSGLDGLTGMRLVSHLTSDVLLFRPLLSTARSTIEWWVDKSNVPFVEDATNEDTDFTRNFIRHNIMPQLNYYSYFGAIPMSQMAFLLQDDADYLNQLAQEVIVQGRWEGEDWSMPYSVWTLLPNPVKSRVLRFVHRQLTTAQLELKHVREAHRLLSFGDVRKQITLPGNVHAWLVNEGSMRLVIAKRPRSKPVPPPDEEIEIALGQTVTWRGRTIQLIEADETSPLILPNSAKLTIRGRRDGDKIRPEGLNGKHKPLNKWFISEKFSKEKRDFVPLLCIDGEIAFIGLSEKWIGCYGFTERSLSEESTLRFQDVRLMFLTINNL